MEWYFGEKIVVVSYGVVMVLGLVGLLDDGDWYVWNKYYFMNISIIEFMIVFDVNMLVWLNCIEYLEGL